MQGESTQETPKSEPVNSQNSNNAVETKAPTATPEQAFEAPKVEQKLPF